MGEPQKMTKQGVRDLNHPIPKKQPAPLEPKSGSPDDAHLVPPTAVVPEVAVVPPIEP